MCTYVSGQYDKPEGFQELDKHMSQIEDEAYGSKSDKRNRVFYMALPPSVFIEVAQGLKANCYSSKGINRIIVEKPFGKDSESSADMMTKLKKEWSEEEVRRENLGRLTAQTFRIDHYLGKEMVKNVLVLRFGNVLIDSTLNKNMISNVQISFKEPFGTEGRGGYFDEFNIIRDVMQNRAWAWPRRR